MEINLNLIGSKKKNEIKKNSRYIEIINNLAILTMVIALSSLLLFVSSKYMDYKIQSIENINSITGVDAEIVKINEDLSEIEKIQSNYIKWSRVLVNLLSLIPEGNTINKLKLDKINNKMHLSGNSQKRDNFLELKSNLENSDMLSNIESPISNLLRRENIDFSLSADLKL